MHARSENLHDGARSAPEICDIFMNRRANSSYFHEAKILAAVAAKVAATCRWHSKLAIGSGLRGC